MTMKKDKEYLEGKERILAGLERTKGKIMLALDDPDVDIALKAIQHQIGNVKDDIYRVKLQIRNNS